MGKKQMLYLGLVAILLVFTLPRVLRYFSYGKTEGTVLQIAKGEFHGLGGGTAEFAFPVIAYHVDSNEYTYAKGNEVLFFVPKAGDKVTVIYNPKNPELAYLNRPGSFWFSLPHAMIFVLFCLLWVGIVNIIFVKPRRKKSRGSS